MNVQTYLYFDGNCAEAIEFYKTVFGMSVEFQLTFAKGAPELMPEGWEDKIFHATVKFGDTLINMSDSSEPQGKFAAFALLAHVESDEEAQRVFAALQDGGEVKLDMHSTFWASRYGIIKDKFGVMWKVQASK